MPLLPILGRPGVYEFRTAHAYSVGLVVFPNLKLRISRNEPLRKQGSRIAFFSVALAMHIFRPKGLATVTTLSVECAIIVMFVFMGVRVMRLFYRNDDGDDVNTSTE